MNYSCSVALGSARQLSAIFVFFTDVMHFVLNRLIVIITNYYKELLVPQLPLYTNLSMYMVICGLRPSHFIGRFFTRQMLPILIMNTACFISIFCPSRFNIFSFKLKQIISKVLVKCNLMKWSTVSYEMGDGFTKWRMARKLSNYSPNKEP